MPRQAPERRDVHAIARRPLRHASPDRLHLARTVEPGRVGKRWKPRIAPGADVGVDGIDTGRAHADDDVAGLGDGVVHVCGPHHLGASEFGDDDGVHEGGL